jgi:hypothetical protein
MLGVIVLSVKRVLHLLLEGESPAKAINKERIGQAGAVEPHLHILTAVVVVCIDIAHSSPICT